MQERLTRKPWRTNPERMVRKQILLTPDQNRRLKARATAAGVPEADIVRQGIELALDLPADPEQDWRERFKQVMQDEPISEAFAERIRENKRFQREAWRKRLARNRRLMAGD